MVDPITAEIVRNHMECTAAEIIASMVRSAFSPIFTEAHDCSAGVFYYDGTEAQIIARADAVPVHIYGALTSVQVCLDFFQGDLSQGDVLIVSDPYFGGTHIADYTVVKPVFYDGQPVFLPAVRGHLLDSGGPYATGFSPKSREIWHEGFRFAPMKLYEKGELRREVWDLIIGNNRLPTMTEGDIRAMVGACRLGEERIRALCDKYGVDVLRNSVGWIFDYSERQFRQQIRNWPKGRYEATSVLDTDFASRRDVKVAVAITVSEDSLHVDFEGSSPQSEGVINSVPGNTMSYVYGVLSALCRDIPINSGFFRPVTAALPKGTVINPDAPACAAYATICIGCDIGDAMVKACEGFAPDRVATSSVDLLLFYVVGTDARTHQYFIHYDYNCNPTGAGATMGMDGWGCWTPLFSALDLPSIEVSEMQYPCLYRQCELTTDTAAPGQWRGSPAHAFLRETRNAEGNVQSMAWIQGLRHPLQGFRGGRGACGNYAVLRPGRVDEKVIIEAVDGVPTGNGDAYYFLKGGGGGWGDPLERDPARVLEDIRDEYVSIAGAAHDYGVVVTPRALVVDDQRTTELRSELRTRRADDPHWLAYGRKQVLTRVMRLNDAGTAPSAIG